MEDLEMFTGLENINTVLLIVAIAAVLVAACALVFARLKARGVNVPAALHLYGGQGCVFVIFFSWETDRELNI